MAATARAAVVVICVALALSVGSAGATGALDQSQTDVSAGYEAMPTPSFWLAQTFTAGVTGSLDRVSLFLARNGNPGDLTVQIRSAAAGAPSGTILATATVSQSSLPLDGYPAWVTVTFDSPAASNAGTQYAIVLSAAGVDCGSVCYQWGVALGNPYAAGGGWDSFDSGGTWFQPYGPDLDRAFQTYVTHPDPTPPTIALNTPPEGAVYTLNQPVSADYSCADEAGGSGLASCVGGVANGTAIDTTARGLHTFAVTATDNAGNSTSVTHDYTVTYDFSGFLAPVNNPNTVNTGKAGRTYPIKWQLQDANRNFVSSLSTITGITWNSTSCSSFAAQPSDALQTSATGGTGLHYDAEANQFVYNWATPAKGCYIVQLTLDDGQRYLAYFNLS